MNLQALETEMRYIMEDWEVDEHITGLVMAQQYFLKKGVELFGERAEEATLKELSQIHCMDTYTPIHASELTRAERKKALEALFFRTKRRNGMIKGRKCAIGSKKRTFEG